MICFYSKCVWVFSYVNQFSNALDTNSVSYNSIQFNSDTNYLELAEILPLKSSIPKDCSHIRCQSQVLSL